MNDLVIAQIDGQDITLEAALECSGKRRQSPLQGMAENALFFQVIDELGIEVSGEALQEASVAFR